MITRCNDNKDTQHVVIIKITTFMIIFNRLFIVKYITNWTVYSPTLQRCSEPNEWITNEPCWLIKIPWWHQGNQIWLGRFEIICLAIINKQKFLENLRLFANVVWETRYFRAQSMLSWPTNIVPELKFNMYIHFFVMSTRAEMNVENERNLREKWGKSRRKIGWRSP